MPFAIVGSLCAWPNVTESRVFGGHKHAHEAHKDLKGSL